MARGEGPGFVLRRPNPGWKKNRAAPLEMTNIVWAARTTLPPPPGRFAGLPLDAFAARRCYNPATGGGHGYGAAISKTQNLSAGDSCREETMGEISGPLAYLLFAWGLITVVLVALVVYRATLSTKEDDQLYLNKAEVSMMGSDQAILITRLNRLSKPIVALAILSGILLVASASVWVWIGFQNP
jgi:hypothetical protein